MANDPSAVQARRVLGVAESAPPEEVRRSYVDLARRYHPDRFAGASEAEKSQANERMQEINNAWRQVRSGPGTTTRPRVATAPKAPPFPEPVEYATGLPHVVKYGPWLFLLFLLAAIFVVTAFAGSGLSDVSLAEDSVTEGADGAAVATSSPSTTPSTLGRQPASAEIEAVIGQCVEVRDEVVIAFAACTPQASGTLEAAVDPTGGCALGSIPVHHRALNLGMCLKPWGS